MTNPKDPRKRLAALMDALAQHTESMTDEEVLADAAEAGINVDAESSRIRGLLLGAVVKAKKNRLAEAAKAHQSNLAKLASRVSRIPRMPAERRALLMQTLERRPQMKEALVTLQHRDFSAFSDTDVESVLKQLDALGLLGDDESERK